MKLCSLMNSQIFFCISLVLVKRVEFVMFARITFQQVSVGFSSGLYGGSRIILMLFFLMYVSTSLVRCHRSLSMMMHSFLLCLCSLLRNAKYFFLLILGLSFVMTFPMLSAPNVWIFCDLFSTYFMAGFDPWGNHPLIIIGSSLNVASSRNKISYPCLLRTLILRRSFF